MVRRCVQRTPDQPSNSWQVFMYLMAFESNWWPSEPQIAKPLNMAFDVRGRLWVTQSVEYPYPARQGEKRADEIRILEDRDHDGTFEHVQVFADELNIPIGVLPYGEGVYASRYPTFVPARPPIRTVDVTSGKSSSVHSIQVAITHGMVNSLRFGMDGWIYANHGYNNQSRVAGKDGHAISMNSETPSVFNRMGRESKPTPLGRSIPLAVAWMNGAFFIRPTVIANQSLNCFEAVTMKALESHMTAWGSSPR